MDKRVNELRERLWKKKAALQQKENVPVSMGYLITKKKKNFICDPYSLKEKLGLGCREGCLDAGLVFMHMWWKSCIIKVLFMVHWC